LFCKSPEIEVSPYSYRSIHKTLARIISEASGVPEASDIVFLYSFSLYCHWSFKLLATSIVYNSTDYVMVTKTNWHLHCCNIHFPCLLMRYLFFLTCVSNSAGLNCFHGGLVLLLYQKFWTSYFLVLLKLWSLQLLIYYYQQHRSTQG
jgi:hypothetical protein